MENASSCFIMVILCFNCRDLANPSKKKALKCLVNPIKMDIILLQETMGVGNIVKQVLESLFLCWWFISSNTKGKFWAFALVLN